MSLLTRTHGRPKSARLCFHFAERGSRVLMAFWPRAGMYRYHHNARLRAAFLLDHHMGWVRG